MKKIIYYLLFFVTTNFTAQENLSKQEKENLKAFAKTYGYVKYFHPSDEAYELDWGKFAIYGSEKVLRVKNNNELIVTLTELFNPIAPSIAFYKNSKSVKFDERNISPDDIENYKLTFWQHKGLGFGTEGRGNVYRSVRTNAYEIRREKPSFGASSIKLEGSLYAGKKIKISAKAKYKGSQGSGRLWMRVDRREGKKGFFSNMVDNPVIKNTWENFEIIGNVAYDAESILIGFMLLGKGEFEIDDFKFFVEENNQWNEVIIENGDFENIKSKIWYTRGKGYETNYLQDKSNKNHRLRVAFKGDEKRRKTKQIFDVKLEFGEHINEAVNDEIFCQIPLVLYRNSEGTYPKSNLNKLKIFKNKINNLDIYNKSLAFQHGSIINTWNVFQHFYPYFDVVNVNWSKELEKAFLRSKENFESEDLVNNLEQLTATLKDGHVWVYGKNKNNYFPEILWEWIEGKLIITKVNEGSELKIGEEIITINGKSSKDYFKEIEKTISAPTNGWLHHRFKTKSLQGENLSTLNLITSENKKIKIERNLDYRTFYSEFVKDQKPKFKEIEEGIFYLDIDKITIGEIKKNLSELKKAKSIICDLRGYPKGNHELISYLLNENDNSSNWMQIPLIVYPDQKKEVGYNKSGWYMKAYKPKLKANVFFIVDGSAISYAESFMGFVEGYKLATIIGQPTAGTNGNINPFTLPGDYKISWTGMKVIKHDGSQHHGIGVLPNVYVEKTIKGIKEGRDEFLDKAIEMAKK